MLNAINKLKNRLEQKKGQLNQLKQEYQESKKKIQILKKEMEYTQHAQVIIQKVAQETQDELRFKISDIVSLALASVFDRPYKFVVEFPVRRGRTECDFFFERDGMRYEPLEASGGGVVDVACFALRIALWSIGQPRTRPVFILDEPFKNINDPKREVHEKVAEMIRMLSKMMNLQIIIVTMIPEIEDIADKTFIVKNKNRKSIVKSMERGNETI